MVRAKSASKKSRHRLWREFDAARIRSREMFVQFDHLPYLVLTSLPPRGYKRFEAFTSRHDRKTKSHRMLSKQDICVKKIAVSVPRNQEVVNAFR
jgi:hypothetical protein